MSNRDVAPRLRALDERVTELEGGGVKDLEQKARGIVSDWSPYKCPPDEIDLKELTDTITAALQAVREADATVCDEKEADAAMSESNANAMNDKQGSMIARAEHMQARECAAAIRRQGAKETPTAERGGYATEQQQ